MPNIYDRKYKKIKSIFSWLTPYSDINILITNDKVNIWIKMNKKIELIKKNNC